MDFFCCPAWLEYGIFLVRYGRFSELFLHPCTHRRVTLCPWVLRAVWASAWGSLSLALETHARQTATKESRGGTLVHTGGKRSSGAAICLSPLYYPQVVLEKGPGTSDFSHIFVFHYQREKKCPGPRYSSPSFTHRWRRILGSSVCTANTNARPSDDITKPAAAATAAL